MKVESRIPVPWLAVNKIHEPRHCIGKLSKRTTWQHTVHFPPGQNYTEFKLEFNPLKMDLACQTHFSGRLKIGMPSLTTVTSLQTSSMPNLLWQIQTITRFTSILVRNASK